MPQYVQLPDGGFFPLKEGEDPQSALREAEKLYPQAFGILQKKEEVAPPKSGFMPAAKAGVSSLKSDIAALAGRTGLMDEAAAEKYIQEQEAYRQKTFKPTETFGEAPLTKGLELLGGSLPYMAAPIAAGAVAPAGLATLGAAGLASAAQFTGSNLSRQMGEGKTLGETELGSAALAAIPQAALDAVSLKMLPGVRGIFAAVGKEVPEKALQEATKQATAQVVKDYSLATGKAMGVEGLTEAGQQVFERLQAGLAITDEKARNEYFDSFIGGAVLGGAISPAGRYIERGQEAAQREVARGAEQKRLADEAEVAKNQPEALMALDAQYATLKQQMDSIQAAVPAKPGKKASKEDKQAYRDARVASNQALEEFKAANPEYRSVFAEYEKRKDAIAAIKAQQAPAVPAVQPTPEVVPPAPSVPDVTKLMDQYDTLKLQENELAAKMAESPEAYAQLRPQHKELATQISDMAKQIDTLGGTTVKPGEFEAESNATLSALDKQIEAQKAAFAKAADPNNRDYDAADKAAEKLQALTAEREKAAADIEARRKTLQEKQANLVERGQTRPLFTEEEAPIPAPQVEDVTPPNIPGMAKKPEETISAPISTAPVGPTLRDKQAQDSAVRLDAANQTLAQAVQSKDQRRIDAALKEVNKYEAQTSRLSQPFVKGNPIDIFDTSNILREAISRNDWKAVNEYASARQEIDTKTLDEKAKDRTELERVLNDRLGLGGNAPATTEGGAKGEPLRNVERVQKPLDQIAKEHPEFGDKYRQLSTGTYPDSVNRTNIEARRKAEEVQARYDQSPEAFAYDIVMGKIEGLKKKVETKQGNAKRSWLQELTDIAEEHAALQQQVETGIAKPTMREKVAGVQAKLGKGEAPAERQMDAGEIAQAKRRIAKLENEYQRVLNKITPVKNEIVKMYSSLFTVRPLQTVKETEQARVDLAAAPAKKAGEALAAAGSRLKEAQEKLATGEAFQDAEAIAEAKKEIKRLSTMSSEAKRAKRINEGNVRYEAAQSEKMTSLAYALGKETKAFQDALNNAGARLDKLIAKYGKNDPAIAEFKELTRDTLTEVALREGKKTPEFRDAMKDQVKMMQGALGAGVQEAKSRRVKAPETRTAVNVKREERTSTPASAKEPGKATTYKGKAAAKRVNDQDGGTAYRTREEAGETVDSAEAQTFIDKVIAGLPENVKFVYAADPGKIPVSLLKRMAAEGVDPNEAMVQGAVFSDGTVLVVGDQHTDLKDLEETVAHELVGHYGIDTIIGVDKLKAYANKTDLFKLATDIGGDKLLAEVQRVAVANARLGRDEATQKLQVLREIIAHTEEARVTEAFREKAGRWLKELVGMVRAGLRDLGFTKMTSMSTSDVYYALRESRKAFANKQIGPYRAADGQIAFRTKQEPSSSIFARESGVVDKFLGNVMGLAGRVQYIDRFAALSKALKEGQTAGQISSQEALNAEWLLRFGEQRSMYANQFLTNGRVSLVRTDTPNGTAYTYESKKGPNMVDVAAELSKGNFESDTKAEEILTVYEAGKRANQVGWEKLNLENPAKAKEEYNAVMAQLAANPKQKDAVEAASKLYREYNAGLLDFLVETGAISKEKASELKSISYVPFYRVSGNGEVQLMIDKEHPFSIGNIKDEPQLQALVGGNDYIMPIFTSTVQNTFMLTNMGLRNQSVKETSYALRKIGMASRVAEGKGPKGDNVVRFKKKGKDYYALIDKDMYGIPADLVVKGMEGIKTTLPAIVQLMGVPADVLRTFVTRNPTYALRQIVRDPLNAWLTTGTDATPVLSSFKELTKMVAGRSEVEKELMAAGAITSNVFSGDQRDMAKFLKDMSAGKSGWDKAMARLDSLALQGDAATRAVVYKDSLAKGMTKQEALLRTLESMNFSRRGLSPSMQTLSVLIPFFNAQIQGLDVLYRAFKGQMPFSEQLKIRQKLVARGIMLAAGTMTYAMLMEDDEAYKRAKPEERYANWFVYVPGVDEPVRVPIPFELGYLFKALPEAVYNVAMGDEKASKAMGGIGKLLAMTNPFALPQAVKPLTEAVLGKSFYSGDIESEREKKTMMPSERYRESTTEVSKLLGQVTGAVGISPITLDYLMRGYTGPLGIAIVQLANPLLNTEAEAAIAKPSMKASKVPFIGGLFQPVEGRGTLDEAYAEMQEIQQIKGTYNRLVSEGRRAEANAFAQEYANKLSMASISGAVQKQLGEFATQERRIIAHPTMSQEEKDARLKQIDKAKTAYARKFMAAADRTTPQ